MLSPRSFNARPSDLSRATPHPALFSAGSGDIALYSVRIHVVMASSRSRFSSGVNVKFGGGHEIGVASVTGRVARTSTVPCTLAAETRIRGRSVFMTHVTDMASP